VAGIQQKIAYFRKPSYVFVSLHVLTVRGLDIGVDAVEHIPDPQKISVVPLVEKTLFERSGNPFPVGNGRP
jgi:hypothetical protein